MLTTVARLYYAERERFHLAAAAAAESDAARRSHLDLADANARQVAALSKATGMDPAWA